MKLVTFLWSLNAAMALVLAVVCALVWFADRRDIAKLTFCVTALAVAVATPFELGMMSASTPAEMGEQVRWFHVPIFFTMLGQVLFVHVYLGTGRLWLLCTIVLIRMFVLIANFLVEPNFTFLEISSLQHISFLGEQVSVIGQATLRPWHWLATISQLMITAFVVDATIQGWRKSDREARRRARIVSLAFIVPMVCNLALNQSAALGWLHIPIVGTFWFLGTLTIITVEFGRELIQSTRARLQLSELRREWAQVERVNSLGQLASALAHELIQPLTATRANVDAAKLNLRRKNLDRDELASILDDIDHDSTRAGKIIDRMRTFIKGSPVAMQSFALEDVTNDVFSLLRHEATSRHIELNLSLPPGLPPAYGDRIQISQVILNLLTNAMDAVEGQSAGARQVLLQARTADTETIEIIVRDSGPGIPEGRLEEIFKPLFTTKPAGLGVGLALARIIIEEHGGRIWAENGEKNGAVIRFTLPRPGDGPTPKTERNDFEAPRTAVFDS
ncbi:MAG TPA: ATP-binding protein [Steroidobacteraceae bacterium]